MIVVLEGLAAFLVGVEGEVVTVALEELASFLVEVEDEVVIDFLEVLVSLQDAGLPKMYQFSQLH